VGEARFRMRTQGGAPEQRFHLDWQRAEALGDAFFRVDHPLAHLTDPLIPKVMG
jgi:hypothetical protein